MARRDDRTNVGPSAGGDQGVVEQTKHEVKDLAAQVKDETVRAAGEAKGQVEQLMAQQKEQAANRLGGLAGALREAGQKLQESDGEGYGRYADRAAAQVDRLSNYMRERNLGDLMGDLEGLARRHPDLFLGGTLLAGVLIARFLKASSDRGPEGYPMSGYATAPDRYRPRDDYGDRWSAGTGTYEEAYATGTGGL